MIVVLVYGFGFFNAIVCVPQTIPLYTSKLHKETIKMYSGVVCEDTK